MEIILNQQSYQVKQAKTLAELLEELEYSSKGIAVAMNQEVIPQQKWSSFLLTPKMSLLIIKATQGG